MRRSIALLAALALLATIPATVSAGKATKETDHFVGIFCDGISPISGTGFLFLGVSISDTFGPDAGVDFWAAESPTGPPDLVRDFDAPVTASYVGGVFTASIPLETLAGDPVDAATVQATLAPAGEQFLVEDDFRTGNMWQRFTALVQPLAADGTAVVDGLTFDLGLCFAEDTLLTTFQTNPTTSIERFPTSDTNCIVENADGTIGGVFIDLFSSDEAFVDAFLFEGPGSPRNANGFVLLTNGSGSGTLEGFDPETGEPTGETATIDLVLTAGERYGYVLNHGAGKVITRGHLIDVEGTLTFPDMPSFDLSHCVAFTGESKDIFHRPQGPKPTGKVPGNDLPTGALAIAVGSSARQSTRAAALDQEAAYPCMEFDDPFTGEHIVIPVEHTVWFKVTGTGGAVTVDTAGSDFDTVAAAYTSGAGGFTNIACVDDVPLDPIGRTLQSAITFPTTAGTTYWIQVGGFPNGQSFGNLRVAVR
jgi:hypothetical protein